MFIEGERMEEIKLTVFIDDLDRYVELAKENLEYNKICNLEDLIHDMIIYDIEDAINEGNIEVPWNEIMEKIKEKL